MNNEADTLSTAGLVKILFELPDGTPHSSAETLWAEPVGNELYRLRNIPFYVYGYSTEDIVRAVPKDERLTVTGVATRSGHSTYRVFLPEDASVEHFRRDWASLAELGCTFERATRRCVGIDVPPKADVYAVYRVLEDGGRSHLWQFEEGHCGHSLHSQ
jgi:hypothetical protein